MNRMNWRLHDGYQEGKQKMKAKTKSDQSFETYSPLLVHKHTHTQAANGVHTGYSFAFVISSKLCGIEQESFSYNNN